VLLFVNIDENGNIIEALYGQNIIPDREYDFFFYTTEEVATNAFDYRVAIVKMKPELVKKDIQ
jgi:hypothetical protein